jgi:DNA repair protein RadC
MTIMPQTETTGNGIETLSDRELLEILLAKADALAGMIAALQDSIDHTDTGVHGIQQLIDQHMPLLKRWTDPGSAVRGFLPGSKRKAAADAKD